jgi:hypothetical protein
MTKPTNKDIKEMKKIMKTMNQPYVVFIIKKWFYYIPRNIFNDIKDHISSWMLGICIILDGYNQYRHEKKDQKRK